jgi:inner membrane protein involved in colicin E2 resistance
MVKNIIAIIFIFICATFAWFILGATIFQRTYSSEGVAQEKVESLWGTSQSQSPPTALYKKTEPKTVESIENNKVIKRIEQTETPTPLPLESSKIDVEINLEHRQKGLLWYSTYKVMFSGFYAFKNTSDKEEVVTFTLNFPAAQAVYDDLVFTVDNAQVALTNEKNSAVGTAKIGAGKTALLKVGYRSQGLERWQYNFGENVTQVRDFSLEMKTNFKDIDFPDNAISPTKKEEVNGGWKLTWAYKNMLSGYQIAMVMPEKLQPGPLAGRISFFAPVSLFFFFFLLFIVTTLRGIELHPMNYFFLAAAFFAFHLLLAYLVDHISIHLAFAISSIVSVFLVISYLRLVIGMRFATTEAALAQFIYLVAFSYAFFLKGFTGLAITIGSIITLFVVMQITGKIRWKEKFAGLPNEIQPNGTQSENQ